MTKQSKLWVNFINFKHYYTVVIGHKVYVHCSQRITVMYTFNSIHKNFAYENIYIHSIQGVHFEFEINDVMK